jgi:hypothetical protein
VKGKEAIAQVCVPFSFYTGFLPFGNSSSIQKPWPKPYAGRVFFAGFRKMVVILDTIKIYPKFTEGLKCRGYALFATE